MSYKEERKLSTKDLMRKKRFNALCDKMKSAGYNVQNLFYYELGTVGLANLLSFPFAFLLAYFYLLHNTDISDSAFGYRVGLLFAYLFTFLTNIRSGVLPYPMQLFFFILIYLLAISMDDTVALSLDHVAAFENEIAQAGLDTAAVSPKLLPNYTKLKSI